MKSTEKNRAVLAEAIARAWKDDNFRRMLKAAPKKTLIAGGMEIPADMDVIVLENTLSIIHAVLPTIADQERFQSKLDQAFKLISNLPATMELRVVRDTDHVSHMVIPAAPSAVASGALSDDQLEQVAGGKTGTSTVQTQTTATTTTVGAEAEVAVAVAVVVTPCFIT
jgi:hypothetical protein